MFKKKPVKLNRKISSIAHKIKKLNPTLKPPDTWLDSTVNIFLLKLLDKFKKMLYHCDIKIVSLFKK